MSGFTNGRALLVGISDFTTDAYTKYQQTAREARVIGEAIQDPDIAGYDHARVQILDTGVTSQMIEDEFTRLAQDATPTDTVFIYLSSHGDKGTDKDYYLVTHETEYDPDKKMIKAGTGLSGTRIKELLKGIEAQKVVLLINTCFSGSVGATLGPDEDPRGEAFRMQVLASGEGRALITASRASQRSVLDKEAELTYFGQGVLDALRGKRIESTGATIGLVDFYNSVFDYVAEQVGKQQSPVLNIVEAVGRFPIALRPPATGKLGTLGPGDEEEAPAPRPNVPRVVNEVRKADLQAYLMRNMR